MQEDKAKSIRQQPRFSGIFENGDGFSRRIKLHSHIIPNNLNIEKCLTDVENGVSFVAELERRLSEYLDGASVVATNSGTSAMHMALKVVSKRIYGTDNLSGKRVFCSDLCPIEQAVPILYEGGIPTFIDVTDTDYGMDPEALKTAFELYPDMKIVIMNHAYGFPGQIFEVKEICEKHGAVLIENASEAFGARVNGKPVGTIGDIAVLDFGKGKFITCESGGALVCKNENDEFLARNMVALKRDDLPWNHVDTIKYDYGMSELSAAVILGQLDNLDEIIDKKRKIYEYYKENLNEDIITLIKSEDGTEPNYWQPVIMLDSQIEANEDRTADGYSYEDIHGTTSPMEVVDALDAFGADAVLVYMPMSMQPIFENSELVGEDGILDVSKAYAEDNRMFRDECSGDAFMRCVCLPADLSMTEEEQSRIIEIVHSCFNKKSMDRSAFK